MSAPAGGGSPPEAGEMVAERHASVAPLVAEWEELVRRTHAPPFMRPGWIDAWAKVFARDRLEVLAVRARGRLAGVLPLVHGPLGLLRSATSADSLGFEPLAVEPAAAEALARELLAPDPPEVAIDFIDRAGGFYRALDRHARERGFRPLTRTLRESPFIELGVDWERYEASLGGETRRGLRKKRRRLEREGALELRVADGTDRLEELLDTGFRLEGEAWKAGAGSAIESDPVRATYYREVARWAASEGVLRLAFLELDGKPIAFNLCIEDDRNHYVYKTGYDPELGRFSPGIVLALLMIRRSIELGQRRYEFMGKPERWKTSFATGATDTVELFCFSRSPLGRARRFSRVHARPLLRPLRARL